MPRPRKQRHIIELRQREKIISMVFSEGMSKAEVARSLGYPYTTVSTIINKFEDTGAIASKTKSSGASRGPELSEEHIDHICDFVAGHPTATLEEIQQDLKDHGGPSYGPGPSVSITRLHLLLKQRCYITLKRLQDEPECYNNSETIENRKKWTQWFRTQELSFEDAIFFDEAGFNLHSKRTFSRSKPADRAQQEGQPTTPQKNMSLLVAVGKEGVIASEILLGAYNTERFCSFLDNKVLPLVARQRRVFMMDDNSFHRDFDTKQHITSAGHEAHYLPPHSPWLSITEKVFSKVKPAISREDIRTHGTLAACISQQIDTVTAGDCLAWLQESNRWRLVAERGGPLGPQHSAREANLLRG